MPYQTILEIDWFFFQAGFFIKNYKTRAGGR